MKRVLVVVGLMIGASVPAMAQEVILRRSVMDTPGSAQEKQGVDALQPEGAVTGDTYWGVGYWHSTGGCTADGTEARAVACVRQGQDGRKYPAADADCTEPKPPSTRGSADYGSCTYIWKVTGTGEWQNGCSASDTRPVTAQCFRKADDVAVPDDFCDTASKPTVEAGLSSTTCTYTWDIQEWKPWADRCTTETTRDRTVLCKRSDNLPTAPDNCPQPAPVRIEQGANLEGCQYYWEASPWQDSPPNAICGGMTHQVRTAVCRPMADPNTTADEAQCDPKAKPSLEQDVDLKDGCTYSWKIDPWSDWSTTCGVPSTRTRKVSCLRQDGMASHKANCGSNMPDISETGPINAACEIDPKAAFAWVIGTWTDWSTQCGESYRTRLVECKNGYGDVNRDKCSTTDKPEGRESTVVENMCPTWYVGPWTEYSSQCSFTAERTRLVQCQTISGKPLAEADCAALTKPTEMERKSITDGCSTEWILGDWGPTGQCALDVPQTRIVQCVRNMPDGRQTPEEDKNCTGTQPSASRVETLTDACPVNWQTSAWGAYNSTCSDAAYQSRTVWCEKTIPGGATETVADSLCKSEKPSARSTPQAVLTSCTYRWNENDPWSDYNSYCSNNATRTRNVTCDRSDGKVVADSFCGTPPNPFRTDTRAITTSCASIIPAGMMEMGIPSFTASGATVTTTTESFHTSAKSLKVMMSSSSGSVSINFPYTVPFSGRYQVILYYKNNMDFMINLDTTQGTVQRKSLGATDLNSFKMASYYVNLTAGNRNFQISKSDQTGTFFVDSLTITYSP